MPTPTALVDDTTEDRKEIWGPVNLIQYDQPILNQGKVCGGIRQLCPIRGLLEVEINRGGLPGDFKGQSSLPYLSWPEQGNRRLTIQRGPYRRNNVPFNHPCKSSTLWKICKVAGRFVSGSSNRAAGAMPASAPRLQRTPEPLSAGLLPGFNPAAEPLRLQPS